MAALVAADTGEALSQVAADKAKNLLLLSDLSSFVPNIGTQDDRNDGHLHILANNDLY